MKLSQRRQRGKSSLLDVSSSSHQRPKRRMRGSKKRVDKNISDKLHMGQRKPPAGSKGRRGHLILAQASGKQKSGCLRSMDIKLHQKISKAMSKRRGGLRRQGNYEISHALRPPRVPPTNFSPALHHQHKLNTTSRHTLHIGAKEGFSCFQETSRKRSRPKKPRYILTDAQGICKPFIKEFSGKDDSSTLPLLNHDAKEGECLFLPPRKRVKKHKTVSKKASKKTGYCENCRITYTNGLEKHANSAQHKAFAMEDSNWVDIDALCEEVNRRTDEISMWTSKENVDPGS
eukprot:1381396-Amorphochlora_amoeboformis.AAC.1